MDAVSVMASRLELHSQARVLDALYGDFGLDQVYRPLSGLSADVVRSFPAGALAPLPFKPKPPGG